MSFMSPMLAGGFLTTGTTLFFVKFFSSYSYTLILPDALQNNSHATLIGVTLPLLHQRYFLDLFLPLILIANVKFFSAPSFHFRIFLFLPIIFIRGQIIFLCLCYILLMTSAKISYWQSLVPFFTIQLNSFHDSFLSVLKHSWIFLHKQCPSF